MFSVEKKTKEKSIGAEPINIYTTHKIEIKENFTIEIFKADFFRLNVELNTKTNKNDEIELFYYFPVCGADTDKTSRSSTYERPRC